MVSVGYLFLCDSLISLWKRNVEAVIPIDEAPRWVQQLARLLRMLLLAAIATILASSIMSAGMSSDKAPPTESDISQVTTLRHASYCLSLGTSFTHQRFIDFESRLADALSSCSRSLAHHLVPHTTVIQPPNQEDLLHRHPRSSPRHRRGIQGRPNI